MLCEQWIERGAALAPDSRTSARHRSGRTSAAIKLAHPYPTQGEAIRKVGDLYNKTRLTPRVAALMKKIIACQR
ncbi:hypothetical protein V2O64_19885 [Verrucomicrobiaceae bacterium 227]